MATLFNLSGVDSAIERATRRLEALKTIQAIFGEFPEIAEELGVNPSVGEGEGDARDSEGGKPLRRRFIVRNANTGQYVELRRHGSNYDRIRKFFIDNGNEWEQAPRIGEALHLTRGTVATVLWTSHRDKFEQAQVAGSVKKRKWRLTAEALKEKESV